MKQKASKLNTKQLFWTLSSVIMVFVISYAFLVNITILNVVGRQKDQNQIAKLRAATSDLETTYIALSNSITLDLAYTKGFKDVESSQFLVRKDGLSGFTLR